MPSFSFLGEEDINDLVAYLQSLGRKRFDDPANRGVYEAYYPEADADFWIASEHHKPNVDSATAANGGAGIFRQNCAVCHGTNGLGNGPNALAMNKKPANFSRPFYKSYSDKTWYYKVAEGVPGTRMPRWKLILKPEQMWYLVAYLKTLPQDGGEIIQDYQTIDDLDWERQSVLPEQLASKQKQIGVAKLNGTYQAHPGGATGTELNEGAKKGGH
jgi:mono/diheme cytochrome c family protein